MRLSEKTLELSICSQLALHWRRRVIWFGLTQRQEARAGFDAYTRLPGGRLLVLQFKASNHHVSGRRRFHAQHGQMANLRRICRFPRLVFYVFPDVGSTADIAGNPDLIPRTWYLDVMDIPTPINPPTTRLGVPRRSGVHYVDIVPPDATIHSDPVQVRLLNADQLQHVLSAQRDDVAAALDEHGFLSICQNVTRRAVGGIVI